MRTVFITSFHPLISRNIISTAILPELVRSGEVRVVVVVPDYKVRYFTERYGRPHVEFVGVPTGAAVRSRWVSIAKRLAEALPNTRRAAIGRRRTLSGRQKPLLIYWLVYVPIGLLGKSRLAVKFYRWLDFRLSPAGRFAALFERYRPDLVFPADIQNEHDVALMQEARRRGVPIVGMVRSWDNLTMRAVRIVPDELVVPTEIIRDEAARYHWLNPQRITVVGVPHYDRYRRDPTMPREAFLRSIGADPAKKFILYFPICDYRLERNIVDPYVLGILGELGATTVVRFPPAAAVHLGNFAKPARMIYDTPGYEFVPGRVDDRDLTPEDDGRLSNLLAHADLVVSGPSTAVIDAALFDKPVILVDFYPRELPPEERIYEYGVEHILNILATGGARRVRTKGEFLRTIQEYLADPALDRAGRERIVAEQCGRTDGRASVRVATVLLRALAPPKAQEEIVPYHTPAELKGEAAALKAFYSATHCYGFDYHIAAFEKYEHLLAAPCAERRLLDCGTGGGHFLEYLAERGYGELYGFDIGDYRSERGVAAMREFRTLDASTERLPWPDGFFDLATAWCLLAHLENPHHFIRELSRVLKPGGYFFNVMPHIGSLRVRKNFFYTGDLERYTSANDHVAVFTPALFQKTVLRYFEPMSVEYYVDPRIYSNRLGWVKRWGVEARWFGQRKFREWFGANVFYVLRRK